MCQFLGSVSLLSANRPQWPRATLDKENVRRLCEWHQATDQASRDLRPLALPATNAFWPPIRLEEVTSTFIRAGSNFIGVIDSPQAVVAACSIYHRE
jgi:hypothetical protein